MAKKVFLIDQAEAGYLLGVGSRTIQTWSKRTMDPLPVAKQGKRGTPNQYDPPELVQWYVRNELSKLDIADGEVLDLNTERAKLARLQAAKVQLDLDERGGKLYPPDLLIEYLDKMLQHIRSHLLALPSKAAPAVHSCKSVGATAEEIQKYVYDALTELSETDAGSVFKGTTNE